MEGLLFDETMRGMPSGQIGEYGTVVRSGKLQSQWRPKGVTVTIPESSMGRTVSELHNHNHQ